MLSKSQLSEEFQLKSKSNTNESSSYANISEKLQNKLLISSILQYIKKNQFIPEFLASIKHDDTNVNNLLSAIESGDTESTIFSNPDCYLYLLYLIKEEKISFWQGITVYTYLTALMQLSNKQQLKQEDQDVKLLRGLEINHLVNDDKLTPEGEGYLKKICIRFGEADCKIDYQDLVKFVLGLSKTEQWLFKIPYKPSNDEHHYDRLASILVSKTPFLISEDTSVEMSAFWLPSLTLINYILQKISLFPMRMLPIFGSINTETLQKLHSQELHPLSLYAIDVKTNPYDADGNRCGPLIMLLHDLSHTYWATRLTSQEREIIFTRYIPQLKIMKNEAQNIEDNEVVEILANIIDETSDFGSNLHDNFRDTQTRLEKYLLAKFGESCGYFMKLVTSTNNKLGDFAVDRIIFLSSKLYYSISSTKEDEIIWKNNILNAHKSLENIDSINAQMINALLILGMNAANSVDLGRNDKDVDWMECAVDWKEWLKILERTNDSKIIWEIAKNERHGELLTLITRYNLVFFHPYLPMTMEMQKRFKTFLENKIANPSLATEGCQYLNNMKCQ